MSRITTSLTLASAALILVATGAFAGGPTMTRHAAGARDNACCAGNEAKGKPMRHAVAAKTDVAPDGFEYIGGDPLWQPAQPRIELRNGHFVHAANCPFAMTATAPAVQPGGVSPLEPSPGA